MKCGIEFFLVTVVNHVQMILNSLDQRYAYVVLALLIIPPMVPPTCPFRFTSGVLREGLWGTPVPQAPS